MVLTGNMIVTWSLIIVVILTVIEVRRGRVKVPFLFQLMLCFGINRGVSILFPNKHEVICGKYELNISGQYPPTSHEDAYLLY